MKKIILIVIGVLVVIGVTYFLVFTQTSTNQNKSNVSQTGDVRLTGTIQAVDNQQPVDGNLCVKVNDIWIIIGGGDMQAPDPGAIIGFDLNTDLQTYVGKKAEVYAKKTGYDQSLTILYGSKYYFKVVR